MFQRSLVRNAGLATAVAEIIFQGKTAGKNNLVEAFTSGRSNESSDNVAEEASKFGVMKVLSSAPKKWYADSTESQLAGDAAKAMNLVGYSSVDAASVRKNADRDSEVKFSAAPSGSDPRHWEVKGSKTLIWNPNSAVGNSGEKKAFIVFAEHEKTLVPLAVELPGNVAKNSTPTLLSGANGFGGNNNSEVPRILHNFDLTGCKATKLDSVQECQGLALADHTLAHARIQTALAVSGSIDGVLRTLVQYAATTARQDRMLYKTTGTQGHLAAISSAKFALDALVEMALSTEENGSAVADLVKIYAAQALDITLSRAAQVVKYRGSPEMNGVVPQREGLPYQAEFAQLQQLEAMATTLFHLDCPLDTLKLNAVSKFSSSTAAGSLTGLVPQAEDSFRSQTYGLPVLQADASKAAQYAAEKNASDFKIATAADLSANILAAMAAVGKASASAQNEAPAVAGEHRVLASVHLELSSALRKQMIAEGGRKAYREATEEMFKQSSIWGKEFYSTSPVGMDMLPQ